MTINWKRLKSVADVEQAVRSQLPASATVADVKAFASNQQLECSDVVENVIYCSALAASRWWMVRRKWLMRFHFQGNVLNRIDVREGLIGP